jgi:hypothetical protein
MVRVSEIDWSWGGRSGNIVDGQAHGRVRPIFTWINGCSGVIPVEGRTQ